MRINFRQLSFTDLLVNMSLISDDLFDLIDDLGIANMDHLPFHAPNVTDLVKKG
jgi:hypothetical protein